MAQRIEISALWPERKISQSRGWHRSGLVAVALGVAVATGLALPGSSFHARAVLAISEATSPVAAILTRAAAETAVSKPVITHAAESLIGTGFPAPDPDFAERTAVAAHLGGVKATGKTARLAADLQRLITARPSETPGNLEIVASTDEAPRAAQIVSAVTEALIADQDDNVAQSRRKREIEAAARVERLKVEAAAARRRLATLGGYEVDPVALLASAAAQTAKAQSRVNLIHAIIASGAPPLSDRRDLPSAIETLQTAYLDLSHQLAQARETLGERHTTIIGLNAELRHAGASLIAEWRRLGRTAEAELAAAHEREAPLRKLDTSSDTPKRMAIDEARRAIQLVDDRVARALAVSADTAADERGYRLLIAPAIPSFPTGLSLAMRIIFAALAGLGVLGIGLLYRRARRNGLNVALTEIESIDPVHEPIDVLEKGQMPAAEIDRARGQISPSDAGDVDSSPAENTGASTETDATLIQAMLDLIPRLEALDPTFGPVPTVMVASNELIADTTQVALALGRAAADCGHRVLLIEGTRPRPKLAAAADPNADPVLIDLFGSLTIALPAVVGDGALFLVPHLQQGKQIASSLALDGATPLVDDLGAEFDLIVIDGGRCVDAVAADWGADAYVRIGRHRSKRDDEQFSAILGVSPEAILGTVVASTLSRTPSKVITPTVRGSASHHRSAPRTTLASHSVSSATAPRARPRRKIGLR